MKQRNAVKRAKLVRDEKAKVKPKEIETNGDQDQANTTAYAVEVRPCRHDQTVSHSDLPAAHVCFSDLPTTFQIYAQLMTATRATQDLDLPLNFFEFV